MIRKLCQYKGIEIHEAEACKDHIHMLVSIPPKYSVSQIMGYLKGKSSLMIYEKYANEATMKEWIVQGRVEFGKDENGVPTLKSYLKDREYSVPYSVFYKDGRAASKRLATLMGDKVFENPKDEEIIQRIIQFCGTDDGDIILDFFSGSATTAHAMFLADAEQNKHRRTAT